MKNLPIILGIAAIAAMAQEFPICEEFSGEKNITCVAGEENAVVISRFDDGSVGYEFYTKQGKGYIYLDGGVYARSAKRGLSVAEIPSEDKEGYIAEVFNAVMDDIAWAK